MHPLQQLYTDPLIDTNRLSIDPVELKNDIPVLMAVHGAIKPALEQARSAGHVGSSLQSTVKIHVPETADGNHNAVLSVLNKHADELADMFVVSTVYIKTNQDTNSNNLSSDFSFRQECEVHGVKAYVEVHPPEHAKCPRCWRYVAPQEDTLCSRCEDIVQASQ